MADFSWFPQLAIHHYYYHEPINSEIYYGRKQLLNPDLADLTGNINSWRGDRGYSWLVGRLTSTGYSAYLPPNSKIPDLNAHGRGWHAARSFHPGGVITLMSDGSVRFVKDSIPVETWRSLGSRNGGEVISADTY